MTRVGFGDFAPNGTVLVLVLAGFYKHPAPNGAKAQSLSTHQPAKPRLLLEF